MTIDNLRHDSTELTVQSIVRLYDDGFLNLNPGFQRDSVWNVSDRRALIDSVVRNYPLPAIFLYKRIESGQSCYDVIDGKQRLESILMFMGRIRGNRFEASLQLPGDDEQDWYDWKKLCRHERQDLVEGYKLLIIEVDGELSDIINLFLLINSTGKALTSAEKRHARYYDSPLLKTANKLASQYEDYLVEQGVISKNQINRMKHVELMCELLISNHQGSVINKKAVLDRVMKVNSLTSVQLERARVATVTALNRVKRMFPELYRTRFHQLADFYTLVVLVAKFESEKLILTNSQRNKLAQDLLLAFSNGVDHVRDMQHKAKGISDAYSLHRNYLLTVQQATDEVSQRTKREEILRGLLQSLFARKDINRGFSSEQRRIIWNTSASRKCAVCGKTLTWDDFTIDHIKPYSKGGHTALDNAAILCREHNSSKGNR